jgi:hypothetical protein
MAMIDVRSAELFSEGLATDRARRSLLRNTLALPRWGYAVVAPKIVRLCVSLVATLRFGLKRRGLLKEIVSVDLAPDLCCPFGMPLPPALVTRLMQVGVQIVSETRLIGPRLIEQSKL